MFAVRGQNARFGNESEVFLIGRNDRQHPGFGIFESVQYAADLLVLVDQVGRRDHVAVDRRPVFFRREHIGPQVVQLNDAQQGAVFADHRENVPVDGRDKVHDVAERRVHRDFVEIGLHQGGQIEEYQYRTVFVVGQQFAALRQLFRVDRIGFEVVVQRERERGDQHQRDEQRVAVGQFGDQEDRRQRGVHYARHDSCHAHQRKRNDR